MEALILSYALDTNGQNFRFVQAARKYPDVRAFAIGNADPAGVVQRLKEAADKGDELHIRSAHAQPNYLQFPHDIYWHRHRGSPAPCPQHGQSCYMRDPEIKALIHDADVIHLNNSAMAYKHFRIRKPALLHHHGTLFRSNPDNMLSTARHYRMQQCVSTIDLQRPAPELLPWLPTAYDVDALRAFGEAHRRTPDGRVRIGHFPTDREFKHTNLFIQACRELQDEGLPIDIWPPQINVISKGPKEGIPMMSWDEAMEAKASCDILYDQIAYGYGCNAVEAWGMGIPVIAGADDWTLKRMADQWGFLPFAVAGETTLKAVLRGIVVSADMRAEYAERGTAHVRGYHDERPALAILAELYEKAWKLHHRDRIPGKAPAKVTFIKTGSRKVYDEKGNPFAFVDGKLTTDDAHEIERLRLFARRSAAFGVEEVA